MTRIGLASLCLTGVLAGCGLYTHDKDGLDGGVCEPVACPEIPADPLRDPNTGSCTDPTVSCPPPDDNGCSSGCCGVTGATAAEPSCAGACEGLGESACLATAGCHAEYVQGQSNGPTGFPPVFNACWDIEPLQPQEGGGCSNLDAYTCAIHDDCTSVMVPNGSGDLFEYCGAESGGQQCGAITCPLGQHCEMSCPPCNGGSACSCIEGCAPDTGSGSSADPGACSGQVLCNGVPPACPSNTVAGIANDCWTGYCIPLYACNGSNDDPGACTGNGVGAACQIAGPACPSGTTPGIVDNCWSGYCIPLADCAAPSCSQLTTATACEENSSCEAVFTGSNCTCDENGNCTCASETFSTCESLTIANGSAF